MCLTKSAWVDKRSNCKVSSNVAQSTVHFQATWKKSPLSHSGGIWTQSLFVWPVQKRSVKQPAILPVKVLWRFRSTASEASSLHATFTRLIDTNSGMWEEKSVTEADQDTVTGPAQDCSLRCYPPSSLMHRAVTINISKASWFWHAGTRPRLLLRSIWGWVWARNAWEWRVLYKRLINLSHCVNS